MQRLRDNKAVSMVAPNRNFITDQVVTLLRFSQTCEHANSKVQKRPSQLRFLLPSIIITIPSNEAGNTETHKTDRNPPITNHKP